MQIALAARCCDGDNWGYSLGNVREPDKNGFELSCSVVVTDDDGSVEETTLDGFGFIATVL
jgi:hypothetical protein